MAFVVSVYGPSGSGKTTLIERLIPRLAARGLRVGVIKHAHEGFALDPQGKDSWRVWQAGAQAVVLAGPQECFLRQRSDASLRHVLALMPQGLDCILIEGFAREIGANDVGADVHCEVHPEGIRLNGRAIPREDIVAVEELIVRACDGMSATSRTRDG